MLNEKTVNKKEEKAIELLAVLIKLLNDNGINGDYKEICKNLELSKQQQEKEFEKQNILRNSPEYNELSEKYKRMKREQDEKIFSDDLEEIKAEYLDCTAQSIDDLGEIFCIARILGLSNIEAYELVLKLQNRERDSIPVIGKVGSSKGTIKDFYSSDELERLSKDDLDNPDILERAIKSLSKLHR